MTRNTVYKILAILLFLLTIGASLYMNGQFYQLPKLGASYSSLAATLLAINVFAFLLVVLCFSAFGSGSISIDSKQIEQTSGSKRISKNQQETSSANEIQQIDVSGTISRLISGLSSITDAEKFTETVLIKISKEFPIVQGLFFVKEKSSEWYILKGKFAFYSEREVEKFQSGEGLSGQVAKDRRIMNITNVPKDYITILSGLGKGSPENLFILPLIENEETIALIELASFVPINSEIEKTLEVLAQEICPLISKLR